MGSLACGVNQCNSNYYFLERLLKGTEPALLGVNAGSNLNLQAVLAFLEDYSFT